MGIPAGQRYKGSAFDVHSGHVGSMMPGCLQQHDDSFGVTTALLWQGFSNGQDSGVIALAMATVRLPVGVLVSP